MFHNTNYYKLMLQLLPPFWRKARLVAYTDLLQKQVSSIYSAACVFRANTIYYLGFDGRVAKLETLLNNTFDNNDPEDRRIYITDGFENERYYIYKRLEDKPKFLPKFIYTRADYVDTGVDFIVWVPNAVTVSVYDLLLMDALVKRFKLASKRFKIYRV